jgi:hypothetical protein
MRVSFALALAAGIAAGEMGGENALAQRQSELQSPTACSSIPEQLGTLIEAWIDTGAECL